MTRVWKTGPLWKSSRYFVDGDWLARILFDDQHKRYIVKVWNMQRLEWMVQEGRYRNAKEAKAVAMALVAMGDK